MPRVDFRCSLGVPRELKLRTFNRVFNSALMVRWVGVGFWPTRDSAARARRHVLWRHPGNCMVLCACARPFCGASELLARPLLTRHHPACRTVRRHPPASTRTAAHDTGGRLRRRFPRRTPPFQHPLASPPSGVCHSTRSIPIAALIGYGGTLIVGCGSGSGRFSVPSASEGTGVTANE